MNPKTNEAFAEINRDLRQYPTDLETTFNWTTGCDVERIGC